MTETLDMLRRYGDLRERIAVLEDRVDRLCDQLEAGLATGGHTLPTSLEPVEGESNVYRFPDRGPAA